MKTLLFLALAWCAPAQSLYDSYANVGATTCDGSNVGQLALTTEGIYTARCNGSAWDWFYQGQQVTPPPTGGWTLDAQSGSSVTANADGTVTFYFARRGSVALDAVYRTGASSQTITALFCSDLGNIVAGSTDAGNDTADSLGLRDSNGAYESLWSTIGAVANNPPQYYVSIDYWTSATSYHASTWYAGAQSTPTAAKWVGQICHWRRIVEDTDISHRWNLLGAPAGWTEFYSHGKNSFLAAGTHNPAIVGYDYGNGQHVTLISWKQE